MLLASGLTGALASTVTMSGAHFDISFDSATVGLFGTPTLTGDVLAWHPGGAPGFTAQTTGVAGGIFTTNSTFALMVTAKSGFSLSSFGLAEAGDYAYFSSPSAGSFAGVSVNGQLGVSVPPSLTPTVSAIAASTLFVGNTFLDFTTKNWSATAAAIAVPTATTVANVSVQNILRAYGSDLFSSAYIEKKDVFLTVGVTSVPEPETYAMMLAGLGAIGFLAARRRV